MPEEPSSWILELRSRLQEPPPRTADGAGLVVLLPLFVDGGHLCLLFTEHGTEHGPRRLGFVGGGRESEEDAWRVAVRVARDALGLEPQRILRLGELDPVVGLDGSVIVPCVVAIPGPKGGNGFALPQEAMGLALGLFGAVPEARAISIDGEERSFPLYRLPEHEVWGPPAEILENLLDRLGL